MLYRSLLLTLSTAHAWNDCAFPEVGYFAMDESPGISYSYAIAAMNGNMYSGGYTKGNFALVGVTDSGDVNPVPAAAIFGDTTTDLQNLYVSETDSTGSMTKSWWFKGSAIQKGQIGHGAQTNSIDSHSGLHKMMDKQHLAVKGGFRQLLDLPDGTQWTSAGRDNTQWQVPFVMKLDVSSTNGIGAGTTGWAKLMDVGHAGGAAVHSVDGDTSGNMIVSYEGCSIYNTSAVGYDAYGRPVSGAAEGCTDHISKLSSADGSVVWTKPVPHGLRSCRVITDGSFFCGWTMSASDGTLDFGGATVVSEDGKSGVVKFGSDGVAVWAKATAEHSLGDLAVSADGSLLATVGSTGGRGALGQASRISTAAGTEGNVLWNDPVGGVGSHGFRGVEVTDDNNEVFVFGQITGEATLTDAAGLETKLKSRGSYEAYIAVYDASDGSGKYAMDGGGTGMEYFFAFSKDPDTHAMYVGGTSRSEHITWGDVTRKNVMYNGQPGKNNPDTSSPVGSSKAFVVQIKTGSVAVASCLSNCNPSFPLQASDVKAGYCYIDRYCYADGQSAPYSGDECRKCDAATNAIEWSAPDTTSMCYIDGKCIAEGTHARVMTGMGSRGPTYGDDPCSKCDPSVSGTEYTAVAHGCKLATHFVGAACYDDDGMMTMNETAKVKLMADKVSADSALRATQAIVATRDAEIVTHGNTINAMKATKTGLEASLAAGKEALKKCEDEEGTPTWAIAIIIVIGVMFLLMLATLFILVSKEQQGKPIFMPMSTSGGKRVPEAAA